MSALISRWGAPITYVTAVVLVGLTLITVLGRSPDTRSNFQASAAGYDRTEVALVGAARPYQGLRANRGPEPQALYVGAGCANCHGLSGEGGTVGPDIWKVNAADMLDAVRKGGHGMPSFANERLTDDEVATLNAYLAGQRKRVTAGAAIGPGAPAGP